MTEATKPGTVVAEPTKRHIVLSLQSNMHSVFVYVHDGPPVCMAPIMSEDIHKDAVCAVPLDNLEMSSMNVEEICKFIREQYAAHSRPTKQCESWKAHDITRNGVWAMSSYGKAEPKDRGMARQSNTSHCIGTFWTEREISVIDSLSKKQGLSHVGVLRQALRNYQLIVEGVPQLPDKAAPVAKTPIGIPRDILEHEYRHEHGLLQPGECHKELIEALEKLAREASGFLQMADPETHGITNMRVLSARIEEAWGVSRKARGTE